MILVDRETGVMLLLRRGRGGSYSSRLGLSLLLSMAQRLMILLGAIVLPGRLFVLAVLLLVGVEMLRLQHGVAGVGYRVKPESFSGQPARWEECRQVRGRANPANGQTDDSGSD